MTYRIFTAAQAKEWGWKPKEGDEYYSIQSGEWKQCPLWDSSFEVEALNRRPEHSVVTDLLVRVQSLTLEMERQKLATAAIKQELKVFNPLG